RFPVAGRDGIATLQAQLVNMKVGGFISEYDYEVALQVATVICRGDVDPGALVDEASMLRLERLPFLHLLTQPKTQERIAGMLKTGKPVRNRKDRRCHQYNQRILSRQPVLLAARLRAASSCTGAPPNFRPPPTAARWRRCPPWTRAPSRTPPGAGPPP